jgi:hypothetical protein
MRCRERRSELVIKVEPELKEPEEEEEFSAANFET